MRGVAVASAVALAASCSTGGSESGSGEPVAAAATPTTEAATTMTEATTTTAATTTTTTIPEPAVGDLVWSVPHHPTRPSVVHHLGEHVLMTVDSGLVAEDYSQTVPSTGLDGDPRSAFVSVDTATGEQVASVVLGNQDGEPSALMSTTSLLAAAMSVRIDPASGFDAEREIPVLTLYDMTTGDERWSVDLHGDAIYGPRIAALSDDMVTVDFDSELRGYRVSDGSEAWTADAEEFTEGSPDGRFVVTNHAGYYVDDQDFPMRSVVIDTATGAEIGSQSPSDLYESEIRFRWLSPSVVLFDYFAHIVVWKVSSEGMTLGHRLEGTLPTSTGPLVNTALNDDESVLFIDLPTDYDVGGMQGIDMATGERLWQLTDVGVGDRLVSAVAVRGNLLSLNARDAGPDETVVVDVTTGETVEVIAGAIHDEQTGVVRDGYFVWQPTDTSLIPTVETTVNVWRTDDIPVGVDGYHDLVFTN